MAGKRGRERERNAHREVQVEGGVNGGGGREGGGERVGREGDRENWKLKTLFYKDCSSGSFKNLSNN